MAQNVGWRWIFIIAAIVSVIGMLMVRGTPESKAPQKEDYRFDLPGVLTFMVAMVALQIFATQGGVWGWTSYASLVLLTVALIVSVLFYRLETNNPNAFVQFACSGTSPIRRDNLEPPSECHHWDLVTMLVLQQGGDMTAQKAGLLTIGYAVTILAFIRYRERLLQRHGPRKPMLWGQLHLAVSILWLMPTNLMLGTYIVLSVALPI